MCCRDFADFDHDTTEFTASSTNVAAPAGVLNNRDPRLVLSYVTSNERNTSVLVETAALVAQGRTVVAVIEDVKAVGSTPSSPPGLAVDLAVFPADEARELNAARDCVRSLAKRFALKPGRGNAVVVQDILEVPCFHSVPVNHVHLQAEHSFDCLI